MRETLLVRRLGGTTFILAALAAGLVPLVAGMPSRAATAVGTATGTRSIFLNGMDISSARSQDLKNVDIHINENGDLFIVAPHYQVNEEDTYVPLSKFVEGLNGPKHRPPQPIQNEVVTSPKAVPTSPEPAPAPGTLMPKAGTPTAQPVTLPAMPASNAAPTEAKADEPPELPDDAAPAEAP